MKTKRLNQVNAVVILQTDKDSLFYYIESTRWWGWNMICKELRISEEYARKIMCKLKDENKVIAKPAFLEKKLVGKGWFAI